jgi:hypothetical protein
MTEEVWAWFKEFVSYGSSQIEKIPIQRRILGMHDAEVLHLFCAMCRCFRRHSGDEDHPVHEVHTGRVMQLWAERLSLFIILPITAYK